MCQGEGANVNLESDKEDEADARKVKFNIYSVSETIVCWSDILQHIIIIDDGLKFTCYN